MRFSLRPTTEVVMLSLILFLSVLGLFNLGSLVAPPKMLFGRALSDLAPSLFPSIILGGLVILSAANLYLLGRSGDQTQGAGLTSSEWSRGVVFFAILTAYALTLQHLGFLISSFLAVAVLSWLLGNRSVLQVAVLSFLAPVLLYLAATRLLAVSLPELNYIELAYARLLGH